MGEDGRKQTEKIYYERKDFWATTSNKQLNFVQHVDSMLTETGRAAVVVPDNVLFEAGAGEKIRRALLARCDVHTLLRLPTGIWYSPGVRADVLFFDKKPASKTAQTRDLWVDDLRTNQHFTLRQNTITSHGGLHPVLPIRPPGRSERRASDSGASATRTSSPATKRISTFSGSNRGHGSCARRVSRRGGGTGGRGI